MKLRAVLTILACNAFTLILISVAGFITICCTPWGQMILEMPNAQYADIVVKYGDPFEMFDKGLQFIRWLFMPAIALLVGMLAGFLCRGADWRISTLGIASLFVFIAARISILDVLAASLYVLVSWTGMKVACSFAVSIRARQRQGTNG